MADDVRILQLGSANFLYIFSDETGDGRLLSVDNIVSILPDYKHGGAMIFLRDSERAVAVDQPPDEIVELLKGSDE